MAYIILFTSAGDDVGKVMITRKIGEGIRWLLEKIVDVVASTGINPNLLTFFGLLGELLGGLPVRDGEKFRSAALVDFFCRFSGHA